MPVVIKKYWWILAGGLLVMLISREKKEFSENFKETSSYNLQPYMSKDSLDKKQYQTEMKINDLSRKMEDVLTRLDRPEEKLENSQPQVFPSGHLRLPNGDVIFPEKPLLQVREAQTRDGRKFYYNSDGDLIEEDLSGRTINHGMKKLLTDRGEIFIDAKKRGKALAYEVPSAVDSDGSAYYQDGEGNIIRVKNGKPIFLGKGRIRIRDGKLEVQTENTTIPAGYIRPIKTIDGRYLPH